MGAVLGLGMGLGLLLLAWAWQVPDLVSWRGRPSPNASLRRLLDEAGLPRWGPTSLVACSALAGGVTAVLVTGAGRSAAVGLAFGLAAAFGPFAHLRARRRLRTDARLDAWPDVIDGLTSAVRAGLALPEALAQLATRGPEELRPAFQAFAQDYRAGGRFPDSLDRLKDRLADPVGDRVVEALRLARDVGGSDLGGLLRTLSSFLRDDARTRSELEGRQAWTVNGARMAVAAPWLVLALLSLRSEAVRAYDSAVGVVVLGGGALACLVAYRAMMRIGRLPREPRVLT
ncbi:MAG: type II secretion system F family protein [Actinomycetes bacterium]